MDVARGWTRASRGERMAPSALAIGGGLAVLAAGMIVVRHGSVSDAEEWTFDLVNDLPEAIYPVAWPFQQIGALAVGPLVAVVAVLLRRYRLAIAAVVVTVLKLATERGVKAIVSRQRPGTSIGPDIELRGDVHLSGESFVSGHAVLVAGLAGVVTPYLPGRWRIVPWLLVGAVMLGRVYVGAHNVLDVVCGAALGVAIAGAVNLVLGPSSPGGPAAEPDSDGSVDLRSDRLVGAFLVGLVFVAPTPPGDGGPNGPAALADNVITVASFDFQESRIVAEVYSQGLEAAGYDVERAFALGPREFVGPALVAGLVEFVPEYAGTAAEFHSLGAAEPTEDVAVTHTELVEAIADQAITALAPAPAQDANAFVVTQETARRLGISTLSDLEAVASQLTLGGPAECPTRQLCAAGLSDVYGIEFKAFLALDAGGPLTVQALADGYVDVGLMFTTDPTIADLDLVELVDDRGLQPAENITPLIRTELIDRWGEDVIEVVDAVSARLTTSEVRRLNASVLGADADFAAVAATWLAEVGA